MMSGRLNFVSGLFLALGRIHPTGVIAEDSQLVAVAQAIPLIPFEHLENIALCVAFHYSTHK